MSASAPPCTVPPIYFLFLLQILCKNHLVGITRQPKAANGLIAAFHIKVLRIFVRLRGGHQRIEALRGHVLLPEGEKLPAESLPTELRKEIEQIQKRRIVPEKVVPKPSGKAAVFLGDIDAAERNGVRKLLRCDVLIAVRQPFDIRFLCIAYLHGVTSKS